MVSPWFPYGDYRVWSGVLGRVWGNIRELLQVNVRPQCARRCASSICVLMCVLNVWVFYVDFCFPHVLSSWGLVLVLDVRPQWVSLICVLDVHPQCASSMSVLNLCSRCASSMCVLNVCLQYTSARIVLKITSTVPLKKFTDGQILRFVFTVKQLNVKWLRAVQTTNVQNYLS